MRNLVEVIQQILDIIPEDKIEIISILNDNKTSVEIAPPEMIPFWWKEIHKNLTDYIFNKEFYYESWRETVRKIWTDEKV